MFFRKCLLSATMMISLAACSSDDAVNNVNVLAGLNQSNSIDVLSVSATNAPTVTTNADNAMLNSNNQLVLNGVTYGFSGGTRGESVIGNEVNPATDMPRRQVRVLTTQSAGNFRTTHARITTFIEGTALASNDPPITRLSQALTGIAPMNPTAPTNAVTYRGQFILQGLSDNQQGNFELEANFMTNAVAGTATMGTAMAGTFSDGMIDTTNRNIINSLVFNGTGTLAGVMVTDMQTQLYGPSLQEIAAIGTTTDNSGNNTRIFSLIGRR